MTPEMEAELFKALGSIATMLEKHGAMLQTHSNQLSRIENTQIRMDERLTRVEAAQDRQGGQLQRIEQTLIRHNERFIHLEGTLASTPQTAEFYELRGRVEELSRRMPTAIA